MQTPDEPIAVLLVEDNVSHAELAIRSLERANVGAKIYHVMDGEAALNFLNHQDIYADPALSPRPHVVLLDLRLPKIDGLEVVRLMKASPNLVSIPVVILTTSKHDEDVARAYANHVNSYLVKPINFEKFQQLMHDLGFYWLIWNYRPQAPNP